MRWGLPYRQDRLLAQPLTSSASSPHPPIIRSWRSCHDPIFILTPHVAWASDEAIQSLANQLITNIEAFVRGEPVNVVS